MKTQPLKLVRKIVAPEGKFAHLRRTRPDF